MLGDDGERVNGRTLLAYEAVLRTLSESTASRLVLGSAAVEERAGSAEERYLPTSTFLFDFGAWLHTADDFACFRLLDTFTRDLAFQQAFARHSGDADASARLCELSAELLPLEDSGLFAWRFLRRTREPFIEAPPALRAARGLAGSGRRRDRLGRRVGAGPEGSHFSAGS
ncbi:MAG: hypothetical protein IPM35_20215 [Myxococcales bacterium]|nr:hypothetical protein [Myxococcales bacterium]